MTAIGFADAEYVYASAVFRRRNGSGCSAFSKQAPAGPLRAVEDVEVVPVIPSTYAKEVQFPVCDYGCR